MRPEAFLRRGGLTLIVVVIGGTGLLKSASYYGTLLRGFDAQFYYAAARSAAVSGDWDVTDDLPLSPWQAPFQTEDGTPVRSDGGILNIFPVGLSLVEAAFLIPARSASIALGLGDDPPGYTRFEVAWVAAGLLIVAAIGLQVLYGFARTLTAPSWAALAVLAAWAGTPLLYQSAWYPFTPHPTTFTVMVLLLAVADRLALSQYTNRYLIAFGALAALLYLTRPHQSAYIVLLAVWKVFGVCRKRWQAWLPGAALGLSICLAALIFQTAVHRLNTGHFSLVAHGTHDHPGISGHFDWSNPRYDIVLVSSARGVFWITPLAAVALVGYLCRARDVPWWGWASLINACISMTILAFWSDPGQGDSFGVRMWSEHLPVVVCGLSVLTSPLGVAATSRRLVASLATCACVAWTGLLTVVYIRGQLQVGMTHADVVAHVVHLLGR